jgi:hypothetical protein
MKRVYVFLPEKRTGRKRERSTSRDLLKNAIAIVDIYWLTKQLVRKNGNIYDEFVCKCDLKENLYIISIGNEERRIPSSSLGEYLKRCDVIRFVSMGKQPNITGYLDVQFTETILHSLSSYYKPSYKEVRNAVKKGMEYLNKKNRVNSFWKPYPQANEGGMATCDAIAALMYPIMGYGIIDRVWWQKDNVVNLSKEGIKAFCDLVKSESLWTEEKISSRRTVKVLKAGSDILTAPGHPFVSINADLILCYYAVDKCVNILRKKDEANEKGLEDFKILETFKESILDDIIVWLLEQQSEKGDKKGLWAENKSLAVNPSPIATSFAIRALSLDWRLRLQHTNRADQVKQKILEGIYALETLLRNKIEGQSSDLRLSELAFSLSSLIEASDNLRLQNYPTIIYEYPNVLLDKVHELFKDPINKCTDQEEIHFYNVTFSTLGPALLALVKCHEVLSRYEGKEEGKEDEKEKKRRKLVELAMPRLRYYTDILARAGCDILEQMGCMVEWRGERWEPATSATASLIIALVEYDAKMNVGA